MRPSERYILNGVIVLVVALFGMDVLLLFTLLSTYWESR